MTTTAVQPVGLRPQSLTEIAFDRIRDAIVNRTLQPGTRISESMLSEMLQTSKTPVREALLRLCHVGLVEPTTRGLRVIMPNRDLIRDAYELRSGLEGSAARTAAARADTAQRQAIVSAAKNSLDSARSQDAAGFGQWDTSFHSVVAQSTGNRLLAKAVDESLVLAFTLRSRDVLTLDDSVHCGQQHVDIAKAIKAGDAEAAARGMHDHIAQVMATVLAAADR
ncbi:GntR family transcriptional regulator [Actinacidiphila sp. ITFR-21]|uniref:GntR family transcriptional regulator n=1 Tax=Actinacidiphila sp. ITFR-21 TaxID=3075199 RepID=UPI00288BD833|nr:GntR family transcriptional regulator [Streptomyces sp. ITFR-21]WNI16470.1 GntR family transcriptional regulator [Streptomyces sp. ITFR-21]